MSDRRSRPSTGRRDAEEPQAKVGARPGGGQGAGGNGEATEVTPDAQLPALDERQVRGLREVGERWASWAQADGARPRALPVDPRLSYQLDRPGRGAFVSIRGRRPGASDDSQDIETTPQADTPDSALGRAGRMVRRVLVGPPLRSTAIAEQRMRIAVALPVLSPDALSSVAYGPEAMMAVLVAAGSAQLGLSLPIGAVLVVLMLAVGMGYRQVIRAFPHGGGSYVVAKERLGARWGLLAAAGLILDYILTVAVSVASGVAAITSALPSVSSAVVPLGLGVIALLVVGNLRGVREAGALFAAPTYMFIAAITLIVVAGLVHAAAHGFHALPPPPRRATEALGVLLILRAFSSGATAMTGIEVISNSVPVFERPEAENAGRTLVIMIALLVAMFVGVVLVAHLLGIAPGSQTVLSQIAHRTVGGGVLYAYVQVATTAILLVAANSAVNGFPRLLYFMARDRYAPMLFLRMGDRLAFTAGIFVLAVPAAILYAAFGGQTEPLIPLFAVGVFVAFTLAQSGMVAHWWAHRERGWRRALAINLIGAVLSGTVAIIAAVTKFTQGAWLVVVLIPAVVGACLRVHRFYEQTRAQLVPRADATLTLPGTDPAAGGAGTDQAAGGAGTDPASGGADAGEVERQGSPDEIGHLAVVPIAVLDQAALRALAYAASLAVPVLAVHLSPSEEEGERFHRYWRQWGDHLPLEVVISPYRATVAPLINYIEELHRQRPDITLTVVVPEIVPRRRWQSILHGRIAPRLRRALVRHEGIVVVSVPFHVRG
ncbi:MAG TPA: APC family permease [Solirubrobacteraceae bacterium]|nr:APC family permease [Solirubrobacteraceae bacterium]